MHALPDGTILDAVKKAIAESNGGASKADVLSDTGLSDGQWNVAFNALLADGTVTKTSAGRSTRASSDDRQLITDGRPKP